MLQDDDVVKRLGEEGKANTINKNVPLKLEREGERLRKHFFTKRTTQKKNGRGRKRRYSKSKKS